MDRNKQLSLQKALVTILGLSFWSYKVFESVQTGLLAHRRINQLRQQKVQDKNESDLLKLKGRGKKIMLLKLHCERTFQSSITSPVGSIQMYYSQYPINRNINSFLGEINSSSIYSIQKQWKAREFNTYLKCGAIAQRNILKLHHEYQQRFPNIFESFIIAVGTIVAFVANSILSLPSIISNHSYFNGPAVGFLKTTVQLLTDRPIIVECIIEDGTITPKVMGLTKQNIIRWYQNSRQNSILKSVFCMLFLYFSVKFFKKYVLRPISNKFQKKEEYKCNLLEAEVDDELMCVICMAKCRNLVFGNCSHLIICHQCFKVRPDQFDKCPLCREPINDKLIYVEQYLHLHQKAK